MRTIPFINLEQQYKLNKSQIDSAIHRVLDHGQYIMGPEVKLFEEQLQTYLGVKHAITCANGTDALILALRALGLKPGDAVFVPSFTFAATAEAVALLGAIPVFVDVDLVTYNLDSDSLNNAWIVAKKLKLNPIGIIAVDLFGQAANYSSIEEFARINKLWIMSDCAQGFGSTHAGYQVCSCKHCNISTTSFFPAKPLGCYGDGGAVFTNDDTIAHLIESYRIHGKGGDKYDNVLVGYNSRLDTIQAAILIEKLKLFPEEIKRRNHIAEQYNNVLKNKVQVPLCHENKEVLVWAQYTVCLRNQNRDTVVQKLKGLGIPTNIYYPKPLHLQPAYENYPKADSLVNSEFLAKHVLSLPMSPYLTNDELEKICKGINEVF